MVLLVTIIDLVNNRQKCKKIIWKPRRVLYTCEIERFAYAAGRLILGILWKTTQQFVKKS